MANSGSKILLAAIAGVAAGIGIGMLIAPSKGSKTRKRLKKRIMGFADLMQDDLSERISAMKTVFADKDTSETEEDLPFEEAKEVK
jgi:gas vesicle protein